MVGELADFARRGRVEDVIDRPLPQRQLLAVRLCLLLELFRTDLAQTQRFVRFPPDARGSVCGHGLGNPERVAQGQEEDGFAVGDDLVVVLAAGAARRWEQREEALTAVGLCGAAGGRNGGARLRHPAHVISPLRRACNAAPHAALTFARGQWLQTGAHVRAHGRARRLSCGRAVPMIRGGLPEPALHGVDAGGHCYYHKRDYILHTGGDRRGPLIIGERREMEGRLRPRQRWLAHFMLGRREVAPIAGVWHS